MRTDVSVLGAKIIAIVALGVVATGCRFKGWESFNTATTPVEYNKKPVGNPYADGGLASATGGLNTKTRYSEGAKVNTGEKLNAAYDQPTKGTGQQPGEYGNVSVSGTGQSNAPGLQPSPSEATRATGNLH